ncbi:MAG TPA: hypothetical protein VKP13_02455 [Nitrospira sp.]|nr:hypothetical protein [Nitrospira sp.]
MSRTLYLLRRPIEQVDQAVFLPGDTKGDVVLLEDGGSSMLAHDGGDVFSLTGKAPYPQISYEELIEKIFQYDHAIVI